jgi:hypothetical protein
MTGFTSKKAAALDEEGFYTAYPKEEDDDTQVYQRPWVGLTFAEICDAEVVATDGFNNFSEVKFARALEAKLKEKNA